MINLKKNIIGGSWSVQLKQLKILIKQILKVMKFNDMERILRQFR